MHYTSKEARFMFVKTFLFYPLDLHFFPSCHILIIPNSCHILCDSKWFKTTPLPLPIICVSELYNLFSDAWCLYCCSTL